MNILKRFFTKTPSVPLPVIDDSRPAEELIFEHFACRFNRNGSLRKADTGESLVLQSQGLYDLLGDLLHRYVQEKLKNEYGLEELWIPPGGSSHCNIFRSLDWESNTEKALVLIQGAGDVRAGVWSRSVCINESLMLGSMLPYVQQAQQEGYAIIILNPNYNRDSRNPRVKVEGSENAVAHCKYVWENYVVKCPAKSFCIVGHSCGGICTLALLREYWEEFAGRVKAIALTDSVHGSCAMLNKKQKAFLRAKAVDWVACNKQLDVKVANDGDNGCTLVSAGHHKHEYTSGYAFPSIFPFFHEMISEGKNSYM